MLLRQPRLSHNRSFNTDSEDSNMKLLVHTPAGLTINDDPRQDCVWIDTPGNSMTLVLQRKPIDEPLGFLEETGELYVSGFRPVFLSLSLKRQEAETFARLFRTKLADRFA